MYKAARSTALPILEIRTGRLTEIPDLVGRVQGSHFHAVPDSLQRRSGYDWRKKPWIDDHS
jgi:hypothetical protein